MAEHGFFFPGRQQRVQRRQDRRAQGDFFLPRGPERMLQRDLSEGGTGTLAPALPATRNPQEGFVNKQQTLDRAPLERSELFFSGMQGLTGGSVFQRNRPTGDVAPRLTPGPAQLRALTNFLQAPRAEGSVLGDAFQQLTTDRGVDPNLMTALEEIIGTRGETNPILGEMLNAIFFQMPKLQGAQLFNRPGEVNQANLSTFLDDFGFADRAIG